MLWDTLVSNGFDAMRRDMEALADWAGRIGDRAAGFPALNAYEDNDAYVLAAFVPGLSREALDIRVEEGMLTLRGDRSLPVEESDGRAYLRQERGHGAFEKTFRFPGKADRSRISAKLENGILIVRIPKAEESKPKSIEIQA
jgi:HSP20 family protein